MPAVLRALADAGTNVRDVTHVVCGEGPGSFTSLRIAGAIAKGIAVGNAVPLYAVSSLALVVAGADVPPGRYLAVLDAMRGERFAALFDRGADGSVTAHGAVQRLGAEALEVEAAARQATRIGPLETLRFAPHAAGVSPLLAAVLCAGPVAVDAWEPTYGRLAEAQVKWEAAHGRPLER